MHASLAPGDKLALVREGLGCRREGKVMMLGDGINDAPALAAGRVGVAMGVAGSAVAMETAEVSLMTNDLTMVPLALRIAFYCRAVIWGNIGFAVVVKIAIVAISFSSNHAKLWMAILADVVTSLLVILVGLTPLYRFQKKARHSRAERKAFFDAYDGDEHELGGHGHGHGHEHSHHAGANECCGNAGTNDCCSHHEHGGHGHEHSHHAGIKDCCGNAGTKDCCSHHEHKGHGHEHSHHAGADDNHHHGHSHGGANECCHDHDHEGHGHEHSHHTG